MVPRSRRTGSGVESASGSTSLTLWDDVLRGGYTRRSYFLGMRILLQRVTQASVTIGDRVAGAIGLGLVLLVGFTHSDTIAEVQWLADKVIGLRLFGDAEGKMNLDLASVDGSVLVISQFTLYGDSAKGRRPSFIDAARPETAMPLYECFLGALRTAGVTVASGEFGAEMQVALVNDGPVTLMLERSAA